MHCLEEWTLKVTDLDDSATFFSVELRDTVSLMKRIQHQLCVFSLPFIAKKAIINPCIYTQTALALKSPKVFTFSTLLLDVHVYYFVVQRSEGVHLMYP